MATDETEKKPEVIFSPREELHSFVTFKMPDSTEMGKDIINSPLYTVYGPGGFANFTVTFFPDEETPKIKRVWGDVNARVGFIQHRATKGRKALLEGAKVTISVVKAGTKYYPMTQKVIDGTCHFAGCFKSFYEEVSTTATGLTIMIEVTLSHGIGKVEKDADANDLPQRCLSKELEGLLTEGKADAWLVGSDGPKKRIPCLKYVLTLRSPTFAKMFTTDGAKEKETSTLVIEDYSSETLHFFWRFLISDSTVGWDSKGGQVAIDMLALGDRYLVPKMVEEAKASLSCQVNDENAVEIIKLAHMVGARELEDLAIEFVGQCGFINPESITELSPESLARVIKVFQKQVVCRKTAD